jgi:hypothetical protein
VSPGRCYICRAEGHRWRDCSYLGRGYYYCGGQGHIRRDCPRRAEFIQGQRPQTQSQQQSITVDRPGRPAQLGASGNRGWPRMQGDRTQGRVFHITQEEVRDAPNVITGTL